MGLVCVTLRRVDLFPEIDSAGTHHPCRRPVSPKDETSDIGLPAESRLLPTDPLEPAVPVAGLSTRDYVREDLSPPAQQKALALLSGL